jgi:hypothetical protein
MFYIEAIENSIHGGCWEPIPNHPWVWGNDLFASLQGAVRLACIYFRKGWVDGIRIHYQDETGDYKVIACVLKEGSW